MLVQPRKKQERMKQLSHPSASMPFLCLGILFCVCLITANLLEVKQIAVGPLQLTAGLIVFPISYIINDCLVEVWGYRAARVMIWLGFLMNFLFVLLGAVADALPPAPYWQGQEGFHAIFGLAPRIAAASFIAFLVGSFLNAYVMSRMKVRHRGRHFSLRAIASTIVGEGADSLVFFPLALWGVVPNAELLILIITQIVLKTLYEVMVLPLTIWVVKKAKKHEQLDFFDDGDDYSILRLK